MRSAAGGPAVSNVLTSGGPEPPCATAVRLPAAKGTTKEAVSLARSPPPALGLGLGVGVGVGLGFGLGLGLGLGLGRR